MYGTIEIMSTIILLNGPGSSGKTSIARSIQHLSSEQWLTFGIDTFIQMTPYPEKGRDDEYFSFLPGENEHGPLMSVELKPAADKLFGAMSELAYTLAFRGNNLIIDEILFNEQRLKSYIDRLAEHKVYFIGVKCALDIMQEREFLRQDRAIGLSNGQFSKVHSGIIEYDLIVDTSYSSSFSAAREIINFIDNDNNPKSFDMMRNKLL